MAQPSTGSTGITSLGYDPTTKALLVICRSGDAYRYAGVPKEVYDSLFTAGSKEQFIRESIEGRYPREKYPCMAVGETV
ncbi:MAG: KTSC domain-containing protein [Methanomicrobiales archaeon]|nr:KTSC domain-containing protein [Methanomicrobiales archaeon]